MYAYFSKDKHFPFEVLLLSSNTYYSPLDGAFYFEIPLIDATSSIEYEILRLCILFCLFNLPKYSQNLKKNVILIHRIKSRSEDWYFRDER